MPADDSCSPGLHHLEPLHLLLLCAIKPAAALFEWEGLLRIADSAHHVGVVYAHDRLQVPATPSKDSDRGSREISAYSSYR